MTLDHNYQSIDFKYGSRNASSQNLKLQAYKKALSTYQRMVFRGQMWRLWRAVTRRSTRILNLADLQKDCKLGNTFELGVQTVALSQIAGTVSRSDDFDGRFFPRRGHAPQRWLRIAELFLKNESIPAVDLVQIGDRYFVEDGHHRVSAARALGMKYIDANITVMKVQGSLPWVKENSRIFNKRQLAGNFE